MRMLSARGLAIRGWPVALALLLGAPVVAKPANFGSISLAPGFQPTAKSMTGYAKGAVALHKVVGDRDRNNNRCMGYGSPSPDHVLVLKKNFSKLQLQVNSGNKDTTLLLKGPGNQLYCADDSGRGKDAGLVANNLKAGPYKVWVGTFDLGDNYRYTLTVKE